MIDTISEYAIKLRWLKKIAYVLVLAFAGLFVYALFFNKSQASDIYLIPSILGFIWSLLLINITTIFPNVPTAVNPEDKFFTRVKTRLKRFFYYLVGILFLIISASVVFLSFRLIYVWTESFVS